jgi:hypothetical protein
VVGLIGARLIDPKRANLPIWSFLRPYTLEPDMTRVAAALIVGVASCLGACSPQVKSQGQHKDVTATYSTGTLTSTLPDTARVPAIIAAADQTLRARGYAVQRSNATEEVGEIVANAPRYNNYPRVKLRALRQSGGTNVEVSVEPFGDQELSRSVLDGVLQKLGL